MWPALGLLGSVGLVVLAFAILRVVPRWVARTRRTLLLRISPVLELLLLFSVLAAAMRILAGDSAGRGGGVAIALVLVLVAAHQQVRDYLAGVALRAGGRLALGDTLRITEDGGTRGVLIGMGLLRATLDTIEGTVLIPWTVLARGAVERVRPEHNGVRHHFEVAWPPGVDLGEAAKRVRSVVLLDGGSVGSRAPGVRPTGVGSLEIAVVALDSVRAYELERKVRRVLGE